MLLSSKSISSSVGGGAEAVACFVFLVGVEQCNVVGHDNRVGDPNARLYSQTWSKQAGSNTSKQYIPRQKSIPIKRRGSGQAANSQQTRKQSKDQNTCKLGNTER